MKHVKSLVSVIVLVTILSTIPTSLMALDYSMDTDLSAANASFKGEGGQDTSGYSVAIAGDVNGDGFDDLLIGARMNNAGGGGAGQVYLIFGKPSGWAMDAVLSNADASFWGEEPNDGAGMCVAGAGDVNGDGFDDILIGANGNDAGGANAGQTYLLFGKASGWAMDTDLSNADASFWGEHAADDSGRYVAGAGDVNNDGYDDFLIGAATNDDGGTDAGQTYLIFGKASGWAMDKSLGTANASFIGESANDYSGRVGPVTGDVNGDGFDDILIGAFGDDDAGNGAGQVYLIFGKASGWTMGDDLSNSDASFWGEDSTDYAGSAVSGAGDVNKDGFGDILIGANGDEEGGGGDSGQVYVIFGKASGWSNDVSLSTSNASYLGESFSNLLGSQVASAGDVNGDGYDDLLMSAYRNSAGGNDAGQTYLVLGKASGWAMDVSVANVDASFIGESTGDFSGDGIAGNGDVNGDGHDDILIGAPVNAEGGSFTGQTYLIFPDLNHLPSAVSSVKSYTDKTYSHVKTIAMVNDTIFVELRGTDANSTTIDSAFVRATSNASDQIGITLELRETGSATGRYRGNFTISDQSGEVARTLKAVMGEMVSVKSLQDPLKLSKVFLVAPVVLNPLVDDTTATEDLAYSAHYWAQGGNASNVWDFDTNASWLNWNTTTHNLTGTPDNTEVGSYFVRINVTHGTYSSDEHNFTLVVQNTPPVIETQNVLTATEDLPYSAHYASSDDGEGTITWSMQTNASAWLTFNATTQNLTGLPINADVGEYYVNITVDDGNGGTDFTNFTLEVLNVNDGPGITTADVDSATEDVLYSVDYNAVDVDANDVLTWSLKTNAGAWLTINTTSGVLSGTPSNDNVGQFYVNVTVKDTAMALDFSNFTLTVENAEDAPVWKDVPSDVKMNSLGSYTFDVNATDVDAGDILNYGIVVTPILSVALMNRTTGVLVITEPPAGLYLINISVTDAQVTIHHTFKLNVSFKNSAPTSILGTPDNDATVTTAKPTLRWSTSDPDGDTVKIDLYVSVIKASVDKQLATARLLTSSNATSYKYLQYLDLGETYYWTVIPHDGTDAGVCLNGTFAFSVSTSAKINHPPTITGPTKVPTATTGKNYKLTVAGSDPDAGTTLAYTLTGAPAGMVISNTGEITWKPTKSQSGTHTFNVAVSDGEYSASTPVTLKVKKAPQGATLASMMVPILLILLLIVAAIVLLAVSMRKTPAVEGDEEDADEEKAEDKEEEEDAEKDEEKKDVDEEKDEADKGKDEEGKEEE